MRDFISYNHILSFLLYDSVEELKKLQWVNPLGRLCRRCMEIDNKFTNPILAFDSYFEYLTIIWHRYMIEFERYDACIHEESNLRPKSPGTYEFSERDWNLYYLEKTLLTELRLDYESFVIFSRILMDKIARIAQLLLGKDNIPSFSSFDDHKNKFFLKPQNIPYAYNEEYAKLIRENTDWFDNFLKASRDKIMVHSHVPWNGIKGSATGGLRLSRMNVLTGSDFKNEIRFMLDLKRRYVQAYPELKEVPDNLWEIIEFFMFHNVKLGVKDKGDFYATLHRTGAQLPSLRYLAICVLTFLKRFAKIFEKDFSK